MVVPLGSVSAHALYREGADPKLHSRAGTAEIAQHEAHPNRIARKLGLPGELHVSGDTETVLKWTATPG
jgi:hypothetical protein